MKEAANEKRDQKPGKGLKPKHFLKGSRATAPRISLTGMAFREQYAIALLHQHAGESLAGPIIDFPFVARFL
jgi:hypothetical protein